LAAVPLDANREHAIQSSMDEQALKPGALGIERAESPRRGAPLEETVVELYSTLRSALVGYAYQFVRSTGDSEDLVQVAFLKLFDQLQRNAEIQNLRGWLYRVVHNLAIDHIRRRGADEVAVNDWSSNRPDQTSQTTEDGLIAKQELARSLEGLNERERHCVMLRAEGLSYQEIGSVVGISPKSVSVYLCRGLKKFEGRNDAKGE